MAMKSETPEHLLQSCIPSHHPIQNCPRLGGRPGSDDSCAAAAASYYIFRLRHGFYLYNGDAYVSIRPKRKGGKDSAWK
jgi:hypothetical protein